MSLSRKIDLCSCYAEIACVGYDAIFFKLIVDEYPAQESVAEDKCDSEDINNVLNHDLKFEFDWRMRYLARGIARSHIYLVV